MSAILTIDDSLWPVVVYRLRGVMSDEQCQEVIDRSNAFLARPERYVSIADLRHAGIVPASQRRVLAEWLRDQQPVFRERLMAHATLLTSASTRLMVSAICYMKPLPMPHITVPHMEGALPFVLGKLREVGLRHEAERAQLRLDRLSPSVG
jgi:hypothetical protein